MIQLDFILAVGLIAVLSISIWMGLTFNRLRKAKRFGVALVGNAHPGLDLPLKTTLSDRFSLVKFLNLPTESLSLKIDLSPELIETLVQIEQSTGDSLDEVLAKSIALYRMSVEAHQEGKRIGVFDREFELEREVVGFEHKASDDFDHPRRIPRRDGRPLRPRGSA